jgi:hypothetical protein
MALVRRLSEIKKQRQAVHEEVDCAYSVFSDAQGRTYLQLETFGSPTRKLRGKTSQSIQFDETALRRLSRIIDSVLS